MHLSTKTLLTILSLFQSAQSQASGNGATTRYFDCCKPSCSWPGKAPLLGGSSPVALCDRNDNPLADHNTPSACNSGSSYTCSNQTPWAVNSNLAYGYAAVNIAGGSESSWCCACYELTFTSGPVAGKKMIVQATNTGGDLGSNQFDLAMPGGGLGIFDACTSEYGTPAGGWGAQYGGISDRSQCNNFPAKLQPGCFWRFDWFMNADNPAVTFRQVSCPAALSARTGCTRADDGQMPQLGSPSSATTSMISVSTTAPPSSTVAASSSTTSSAVVQPTLGGGLAPKWGQCGGINWNGPTTCVAGTTCQYQNPYYSQCLEPASPVQPPTTTTTATTTTTSKTTTTTTTTSAQPTSPNAVVAPQWGQCGGLNWTGPTTCTGGTSCQYQNPYYSQCLAVASPGDAGAAPKYGQCGGANWTGPRTCVAYTTCQYQNPYYSQCL